MKILKNIIKILDKKYGMDIAGPIQDQDQMIIRKAYYNALIPYFNQIDLARSLNRKHSTVYRYANSHYEDMKVYPYKEAYELTRTQYMQMLKDQPIMAMVDPGKITEAVVNIRMQLAEIENQIILMRNANS
jgi:hypothetical protein